MKKISLKGIKSNLSRNEMRTIMAGGGPSCISTPACPSGCSDGWDCSKCFSCKGGIPPEVNY